MGIWRRGAQTTDRWVDRFGYWLAAFAPTGLFGLVMSGVANAFQPIAQYGWGATVFAGFGAALLATLVVAVAMIAWRYFNPLSPSTLASETPVSALVPAQTTGLDIILARLDVLEGKFTTVATVEDLNKLNGRLGDLEQKVSTTSDDLRTINQEWPILADCLSTQVQVSLLFNHLPKFPKIEGVLDSTTVKTHALRYDGYCKEVARLLVRNDVLHDFPDALRHAEGEAEISLRDMPDDDRPAAVNPYDFRALVIAKFRAEMAHTYAVQQRETMVNDGRHAIQRLTPKPPFNRRST